MKKYYPFLLVLGLMLSTHVGSVFAQDTTWVQTYTYDTLWTRRAKFYFPTANEQYRKILMYFKIKCYATVSGDGNYPCGQWDGIWPNIVYDHRGKLDSTARSGSFFTLNGNTAYVDTVRCSLHPQYDIYKSYLYNTVVDNTTSASSFTVGSAASAQPHPFNFATGKERAQFIWKASELTAAGLTAGNITGLKLNFQNNGGILNNAVIRMKQVPINSFSVNAMIVDTLTTVYNFSKTITTAGLNNFQFRTPFVWDGVSNILIDFSFDNSAAAAANLLLGEDQSYASGLYSNTTNFAMSSYGNTGGRIRFPSALNMFAGKAPRTYDMWMNVDSFIAPVSTLFASGSRDGNSKDFTMRLATPDNNYWLNFDGNPPSVNFSGPNTKQVWKHFCVTYANDTIRFYINGEQVSVKKRSGLNTVADGDFLLGEERIGGYFFLGKYSHLRIWDKALSAADIKNWVGKDITSAHPDYNHLKADYRINTGSLGTVADQSPLSQPQGVISGNVWWQKVKASDIYYNAQTLNWRPQIVFQRDVYSSHVDSVLVRDTITVPPALITMYGNPYGNYVINDSAPNNPSTSTGSLSGWVNKYSYTYENGVQVDSTLNVKDTTIINHHTNWYSNTVEYEIGSSISPYGIQLNLGDGRTRVYDVTDYYQILQDTVDLLVGKDWELQDVKFAFIKGQPAAEVLRVAQPWIKGRQAFSYGRLAADLDLPPQTITLAPNTDQVKFRSIITGHGGDENATTDYENGCCEFYYNNHFYKSNGQDLKVFRIERTNCDQNPMYPQGGTWVYNREGWCPGDIIKPYDCNVTSAMSGGQINLDYSPAPVPAGNDSLGNGVYHVALQVVEYKKPGRNNDVELYDINKPSDAFAMSRVNPICNTPQVIIRNAGRNNLTSAVIKYKVSGGAEKFYNWTGNLKFLDTTLVDLPTSGTGFWNGDQSNKFIVYTSLPNGVADEYTGNDSAYSFFNMPDILPKKVVINFKANRNPDEDAYTLKNEDGIVILEKGDFHASDSFKLFSDTLNLPVGCYTFVLNDNYGNGLRWWAAPYQGSGSISISTPNGDTLKKFNPDFGYQVFYTFSVLNPSGIHKINFDNDVAVFPNPNNGDFTVQLQNIIGKVDLELTNVLGQSLMKETMTCLGSKVSKDFSVRLAPGVYLLRMINGDQQSVKKITIK